MEEREIIVGSGAWRFRDIACAAAKAGRSVGESIDDPLGIPSVVEVGCTLVAAILRGAELRFDFLIENAPPSEVEFNCRNVGISSLRLTLSHDQSLLKTGVANLGIMHLSRAVRILGRIITPHCKKRP
jgi:hypothetical protein